VSQERIFAQKTDGKRKMGLQEARRRRRRRSKQAMGGAQQPTKDSNHVKACNSKTSHNNNKNTHKQNTNQLAENPYGLDDG
jgi:hypothetical protein